MIYYLRWICWLPLSPMLLLCGIVAWIFDGGTGWRDFWEEVVPKRK